MTSYYTDVVISPAIPLADMTPLERLYLSTAFEEEIPEAGGLASYGAPENGIANIGIVGRADLAAAIAQSRALDCGLVSIFERLLEAAAEAEEIDFDLDDLDTQYTLVLQAIVRRSANIDRFIVYHAFSCGKLRMNGFGGAVDLIEADRIESWSTDEQVRQWLEPAAA
jgi:hypothetical protein